MQILNSLWSPDDSLASFVIWELRLPRFILAFFVGAALGMAGAIIQSITRNPIGSPSLMGVTSGAAFAIILSMAVLDISQQHRLWIGTIGGFVAAAITFSMAWKTRLDPIYLTLSGMSISLFFAAGITIMLITSEIEAQGIYVWLTGSLNDRTWHHVWQIVPYAFVGLILGAILSRPLDLLLLDEDTGKAIGLNIMRWRLILGLLAVVLTAVTVSIAGPISFIGLIAPHIVRFFLNQPNQAVSHKLLLPLSALVGGSLVAVADIPANIQQVPVGIFSILVGVPVFIWLISRQLRSSHG